MRKAKKLLVTLLVLTFVMSTFSVGFAATTADTKDLPTEVVRAMALGYLKGDAQGNLNLDKPITRAEALAIIIRVSGLETSAELMKGQTKFADVNPDPSLQWATGYINLGVGQKIINGYPDGTFRGNANVTYAEMAKMILYAMNYGVTVEGAPWPAGVMGKADDLGLFDKVSSAPDAPAIRGDVVKMIDNSLTIKHLEQTGYGDLKQYVEGDKTFLSKMDVDELEDVRVTEIARVNDKLDDDEIELTEYDKNGKKEDSNIYTLIADVNPEAIFGLKVDAWVNDDDEVFFVDVATDEKDILLDTVDESDKKEITLKDVDKTYKWIEDTEPIVYLNFAGVALDKIPEDAYGKVVLERGRVAFANLFEFEKVGVVTKVDGKVIEFINIDTDEDELDLSDYDDVYIYNPDFSKADAKDIKEDSAIFFWEGDDDDVYIIVKNETVKGKVDSVKEDKIKVDGKEYKRGSFKDTKALITLDKGDNYENWKDLEAVEDFVDEDVMLVLDLRGRVLLVTGAAKATSGNLYGIVTYTKSGRYPTLTVFNKEGKEVDYVAESSKEFDDLTSLKYNAVPPEYAALKYKLTSDSEIAEEKSVYAAIDKTGIKSSKSYDSDVKDYEVIFEGKLTKGTDKKFIKLDEGASNEKSFYITNDTVIMKALNKDGELDPELVSVDRFISIGISDNNEAVVFGEKGKDADFIVMLNKNFEGTEEDYFYGVVTDKPYKSGGFYYATINVFGEGEKDYKINDAADFKKGTVVGFNLNSKDEAVPKKKPVKANINEYKDGYLKTSEGTFKVDSAAVLYNLDKDGDLDKKITRTKLGDYKEIKYVLDDNKTIVAATVSEKVTDPGKDTTTGTVTYVDANGKAITEDIVLKSGESKAINVKYYNSTTKLVTIDANKAKLYVEDNETVAEVVYAKNAAAVNVNPGATANLFATNLTLGTGNGLAPGKEYTVKLILNDELQDETLSVYVKDNNKAVDKIVIQGVEATEASGTWTVQLPLGLDPERVTVKVSDIQLKSAKAKVVDLTQDENDKTRWTFDVEAEDGTKLGTQTIKLVETKISGTNSNASRTGKVVTVTVKDNSDNPVKGLKQSDFVFKLSDNTVVGIANFVESNTDLGRYVITLDVEDTVNLTGLTLEVAGVTIATITTTP